MSWPHRWTCTRAAAGSQNADTGAYTPGTTSAEVYDGPADCQDVGETLTRDASGRPATMSEAVVYLEDESAVPLHNPGDAGVVTWEDGSTSDAEVEKVVRLDGKLHLRWL